MDLAVADLLEEEEQKLSKLTTRAKPQHIEPAADYIPLDFDEERNKLDRARTANKARKHDTRYKEERDYHSSDAGSPAPKSSRSIRSRDGVRHDSDRDSANGSVRDDLTRRRSRSPEPGRLISHARVRDDDYRRHRDDGGDRYYRPSAHSRRNDRSPDRNRDRHDLMDVDRPPRGKEGSRMFRTGYDDSQGDRYVRREARRNQEFRSDHGRKAEPEIHEQSDKCTVFVKQLAASLRGKEFKRFFEQVGPVVDVQIVRDRISHRSKGVGYVTFEKEESVEKALNLTGHKLLDVPIIVERTDAEKNRTARTAPTSTFSNGQPFNRLYVGNIQFSVSEDDLRGVFESFGELDIVQLLKDDNGRSKGYAFVHFAQASDAKIALEQMQGFEIAGRNIRVGLGNDRSVEDAQAVSQRFNASHDAQQGSAFSGLGGRGQHAGGSGNFDRAGAREVDKAGGASALDDHDVAGVNFANYSRDSLMRKLARTEEPDSKSNTKQNAKAPVQQAKATRCVCLKNMWSSEDTAEPNWIEELERDVRDECNDKYGVVLHIGVDPGSNEGEIYVKFDRAQGGENAYRGLNGRFFGGQIISAAYVVDAVYNAMFPKSANV